MTYLGEMSSLLTFVALLSFGRAGFCNISFLQTFLCQQAVVLDFALRQAYQAV